MKKTKGWTYVSDLDIFGDDTADDVNVDPTVDDIDVLGDVKEDTVPVPDVPEVPAVVAPEAPVESVDEVSKGDSEIEDIDKWLDDLLKNATQVEEKVDEVQAAVEATGDEELIKLVDDLQTMLAETKVENDELKKQVEISNNRYLNKFGSEEELSIYKGEVEKLQGNPKLMAFVKYFGTDNEKIKPKLISIASDFLYDLTGQDISSLIEEKDKAGLSILNAAGSDAQMIPDTKVMEDVEDTFDDSWLFGK